MPSGATTAGCCGVLATLASNRSGSDASGTGRRVSFQCRTTRSCSPEPTVPYRLTGRAGSRATPSSSRSRRPASRSTVSRSNRSALVLHRPAEPRGAAVGPVPVVELEGQIERGGVRLHRFCADLDVRQGQFTRAGVPQRQHHLEERVPGQGPAGCELFHQQIERHVLVRVGVQAGLPHPAEKFGEGGRRRGRYAARWCSRRSRPDPPASRRRARPPERRRARRPPRRAGRAALPEPPAAP